MISSAVQFLKKEKFYVLLFFVVFAMYGSALLWPDKGAKEADPKSAPAVQEFRQAEQRLQSKIKKAGSMAAYLKAHPDLEMIFGALSLLIALSLAAGLIINFLILFRRGWLDRFVLGPRPPPAVEWKIFMIFKVILLFMAGSFLTGAALGGVFRFLFPAGSLNLNLLLHTFLMDVLCFVFVLYVVRKEGGSARDLGLQVPSRNVPAEWMIGWGAYAAILPVFGLCLAGLVALAQLFHYEPTPHALVNVFLEEQSRSPFLIFFSVFLATVYGPVFEEIFFRGFCYQIFKRRFGIFPAMVISAAFFSLIHANTFAFWPIFILGLALAWIFEKRGSLLPGIILHITHNTVFITYFFMAKRIVQHAGV